MSGLEVAIPVLSAVFALVSAFKDGGVIVEKIRDRRRKRGAQPPNERLHRAFVHGAEQIQQLREEGVDEFGDDFGRDVVTAARLKDVLFALQDAIVKSLAAADSDDAIDDFDPVIASAIQAKKEAVNVLNNLYMTLQRQRTSASHTSTFEPSNPLGARTASILNSAGGESSASEVAVSAAHASSNTTAATTTGATATRTRPASWFTRLRRPSSEMHQKTHPDPRLTPHPSPSDQEILQQSRPQRHALPPLSPRSNARSSAGNSPQLRRMSNNLLSASPSLSPRERRVSTDTMGFHGFCEGAWYAQQLQLATAMEPSMRVWFHLSYLYQTVLYLGDTDMNGQDYEWLYHCRKCRFRLHADWSRRGEPQFDDRMQKSGSVYFRHLFLWKSHVDMRDDVRRYRCLLCTQSTVPSNIYQGEDHLFEHIARHEGGIIGGIQVSGPIVVDSAGVSTGSIKTFDFYVSQHSTSSTATFMLPESAVGVRESDLWGSSLFDGDPYENGWTSDNPQSQDRE